MKCRTRMRKGQVWKKKKASNSEPFFCRIIGKAKDDKVKTVCSDGDTHSFIPFMLEKYFELVE